MMFGGKRGVGAAAAIVAAAMSGFLVVAVAAQAAELKSKEAVAADIAATYGVEVLRVREVTIGDRVAYAITVMNPAGNSNTAFQVNTLLADAVTGDLLPVFRHRSAGYAPSGTATYESRVDGMMMRRRSLGE